jgi:hypothetical protein
MRIVCLGAMEKISNIVGGIGLLRLIFLLDVLFSVLVAKRMVSMVIMALGRSHFIWYT